MNEVMDCDIVSTLVSFLFRNEQPRLQFESAWAITNISSGPSMYTQIILNAGKFDLDIYYVTQLTL